MKIDYIFGQKLLRVGCVIAFNLQLFAIATFCQSRTESEIDSIVSKYVSQHLQYISNSKTETRLLYKSSDILNSSTPMSKDYFSIYEVSQTKMSGEQQKGYVIVSDDKRLPEVIGYSETSEFCENNLPPAFVYWLNTFAESVAETSSISQPQGIKEDGVAPILGETRWGQSAPYYNSCPTLGREHCLTGCVATAMAQVMNYYKYPDCGTGSISYRTRSKNLNVNVTLDNQPFDWSNILSSYTNSYSKEQASAVANLMFCCGASVQMDYGVDGSGAYQNDLLPAYINNFGYDKDAAFVSRDLCDIDDWHNLIIRELNEGRPVNYAGSNKTDGGHSFVIDGYRADDQSQRPYYHLNWGWEGICDGYYQIANLHPQENGQYGTAQGFNSGQQMVIGIMPEDGEDHDNYMICTTGVRVSKKTIEPGVAFSVSVNSIYNLSLQTFSGMITAVMIGNNGEEIVIGTTTIKNVRFMNGESNLTIKASTPIDTEEGEYRVELRSKPSGKNEYSQVFSASYSSIKVSNNNEGQEQESSVEMCASDYVVTKDDFDLSLIKTKTYILKNLSLDAFSGVIRMAIINNLGEIVGTFGDSIQIPELAYMDIISSPVKLNGYLPDVIDEGIYVLGIAAKQNNKENYSLIGFAESMSSKPIDSTPIGLPMEVKGDKVIVNGIEFERKQTSNIGNIGCTLGEKIELFDIHGKRVCSIKSLSGIETLVPSGIYILREENGKRRKVFVK